MRDLLVLLIVVGSLPLIFMRPYVGVLMWSWLSYMNPHRLTWGFAYDFPFAQLVGLVTLVALIVTKDRKGVPITGLTMTWMLLVLWFNVTTVFSLYPDLAWQEWDRTMKIQLFSIVTIMLMRDPRYIQWLAAVIALSIGFFGVKGGIFSILTGGNYLVWGPQGSFIGDNNAIGLAMVMVTPLMWFMYLQANKRIYKLAMLGIIGLTVIAILTTHSRGALLAISAMFGFLWLKSRHKGWLGVLLLICVPVLIVAMPPEWKERMHTIKDYKEDGSAMGRINAWGFAFNLAKDRPLTGGGFQTFMPDLFQKYAPEPDRFHDSHSIYFEILGEHGFVGLILFLSVGVIGLRTGGWVIRHARGSPDTQWAADLGAMVQVSMVGYAVGGAFLGLAYFNLYYHLLALMVLLRVQVEDTIAAREAVAADAKRDGAEAPEADDDDPYPDVLPDTDPLVRQRAEADRARAMQRRARAGGGT